MLDVHAEKVVDLVPSGDPHGYTQELHDLYRRLTGIEPNFESLEQAKLACIEAIRVGFFAKLPERVGRPTREYDTRPVTPPWLNQDGTPTRIPDPNEPATHRTYHKEGPVSKAREIFDAMWGSPRKDIIEACAAAGIKRSTAATQYQHYKKSKDAAIEHRNPTTNMPQLAPGVMVNPLQ
jgi:hypothetical protein